MLFIAYITQRFGNRSGQREAVATGSGRSFVVAIDFMTVWGFVPVCLPKGLTVNVRSHAQTQTDTDRHRQAQTGRQTDCTDTDTDIHTRSHAQTQTQTGTDRQADILY